MCRKQRDWIKRGLRLLQPRLRWAGYTACGARAENQDAVMLVDPHASETADLIRRRGVLAVMGDGIGGESGGALASTVAVTAAFETYYHRHTDEASAGRSDTDHDDAAGPIEVMQAAIAAANAAVTRTANDTQLLRMGTTLVMAVLGPSCATVAHVGDSRAYLWRRSSELVALTEDHSVDVVLADKPGQVQARLTRSLGERRNHDASFVVTAFRPGDCLLLCTDGLYRVLDATHITRVLQQGVQPHDIAQALVEQALVCEGATDNITAVVVMLDDARSLCARGLAMTWRSIARRLPRFCSPHSESKSID